MALGKGTMHTRLSYPIIEGIVINSRRLQRIHVVNILEQFVQRLPPYAMEHIYICRCKALVDPTGNTTDLIYGCGEIEHFAISGVKGLHAKTGTRHSYVLPGFQFFKGDTLDLTLHRKL